MEQFAIASVAGSFCGTKFRPCRLRRLTRNDIPSPLSPPVKGGEMLEKNFRLLLTGFCCSCHPEVAPGRRMGRTSFDKYEGYATCPKGERSERVSSIAWDCFLRSPSGAPQASPFGLTGAQCLQNDMRSYSVRKKVRPLNRGGAVECCPVSLKGLSHRLSVERR